MTIAIGAIVLAIVVVAFYLYDRTSGPTPPGGAGKTPAAQPTPTKPTDLDFRIVKRTGLTKPVGPRPLAGAATKVRQLKPIDGIEIQRHTINTQARCRLTGRTLADCQCAKHKEM